MKWTVIEEIRDILEDIEEDLVEGNGYEMELKEEVSNDLCEMRNELESMRQKLEED